MEQCFAIPIWPTSYFLAGVGTDLCGPTAGLVGLWRGPYGVGRCLAGDLSLWIWGGVVRGRSVVVSPRLRRDLRRTIGHYPRSHVFVLVSRAARGGY